MNQTVPGKRLSLTVVSDHEFDAAIAISRWVKSPGLLSAVAKPFTDAVNALSGEPYEHEIPPIGVKNIKDMVRVVKNICQMSGGKVSTLEIVGHGSEYEQQIGSDILATVVDVFTGVERLNLDMHAPDLILLRPCFAENAQVKLAGCKVGVNQKLISALSRLWPGVTVIANTANQRAALPGDHGGARVCKNTRCVYEGPGVFDHIDRVLGL